MISEEYDDFEEVFDEATPEPTVAEEVQEFLQVKNSKPAIFIGNFHML